MILGLSRRDVMTLVTAEGALWSAVGATLAYAALMRGVAQNVALFDVNAPEDDRTDIVQAVLQGIPGLNEHSGKFAGTPVDTTKVSFDGLKLAAADVAAYLNQGR